MRKQRILLVEDDARLSNLIATYLQEQGFLVSMERDGNKALEQFLDICPDLLILDVGLPGKSGFEICKSLPENNTTPVLMLTARNSDVDQILGLEFGADDYIIKPVEPRVLLARIHSLLRRAKKSNQEQNGEQVIEELKFDELLINLKTRHVSLHEQPVKLSSSEFDVLSMLASHADKILSRESLYQQLHNRPYDGLGRLVDVRISNLRKKLNDDPEDPSKIKTVWGKGYLFVSDAWQ